MSSGVSSHILQLYDDKEPFTQDSVYTLHRILIARAHRPGVVLIDAADEELGTDRNRIELFLRTILAMTTSGLRVVLAARSEFISHLSGIARSAGDSAKLVEFEAWQLKDLSPAARHHLLKDFEVRSNCIGLSEKVEEHSDLRSFANTPLGVNIISANFETIITGMKEPNKAQLYENALLFLIQRERRYSTDSCTRDSHGVIPIIIRGVLPAARYHPGCTFAPISDGGHPISSPGPAMVGLHFHTTPSWSTWWRGLRRRCCVNKHRQVP